MKSMIAMCSVLVTTLGCVAEDYDLGEVESAVEGENPNAPETGEWCAWEWRFGGRWINGEEQERVRNFLSQAPPCSEAENGIRGMVDQFIVVSSSCPDIGGTYNPLTGRIRIRADQLASATSALRVLVHEYGHKLWAARAGFVDHLTYSESYQVGQPGADGATYEYHCLRDRSWTMDRQMNPGGGGGSDDGGGGGGGEPPTDDGGPSVICEENCAGYNNEVMNLCGDNSDACCDEAGGYIETTCTLL